jgi:hypothetical protein
MTGSLLDRVRLLLRAHRVVEDGHDEQTAAAKLYRPRRPDHPWLKPSIKTRPTAATVTGRVDELESSDGADFIA